MSQSAGACGAFGLLLSDFPCAENLLEDLRQYVEEQIELEDPAGDGFCSPYDVEGVSQFLSRFVALFANEYNVTVPTKGIALHWSGDEDSRPASCNTDSDEWILGWDLGTDPWDYPEMDESFRKVAQWHTWVWVG